MLKLKNNTKGQSRIGYLVIIDPSDKNSFIYAPSDATNILGVIAESVPYRDDCGVITAGEALIYVNSNVNKGDIVRSRKPTDNISTGTSIVAKSSDVPYLQVALARASGKGLVLCHLLISYRFSDSDSIAWNDVGHPPSRIVIDNTTELTTDYTIVCNKTTAMTVDLLPATGSNRVVEIANIGIGEVTVQIYIAVGDPSPDDRIDNETTQILSQWDCMVIKDYAVGYWKII
jgi:hypothetical protein